MATLVANTTAKSVMILFPQLITRQMLGHSLLGLSHGDAAACFRISTSFLSPVPFSFLAHFDCHPLPSTPPLPSTIAISSTVDRRPSTVAILSTVDHSHHHCRRQPMPNPSPPVDCCIIALLHCLEPVVCSFFCRCSFSFFVIVMTSCCCVCCCAAPRRSSLFQQFMTKITFER